MIYKIRDWETLFETCETKKLVHLRWVPIPNKHDGKSFRRIASMKNSCEIFTAWMLILQIASKCHPRGTLIDGDVPIQTDDMAIMTGFPEKIFIDAIKVLSNGKIDWIQPIDSLDYPEITVESPATPADSPVEGKEGIEGKGMEDQQEVESIVSSWNESLCLVKCMSLTSKRVVALKSRLKESFFSENWKQAIERIRQSDFCNGQNDRSWRADIDWFSRPDTVARIMEGKYDNRKSNKKDSCI